MKKLIKDIVCTPSFALSVKCFVVFISWAYMFYFLYMSLQQNNYITDEYVKTLEDRISQFESLWWGFKTDAVFYDDVPEEAAEIDNLLNKPIPFNQSRKK